MVMSHESCGKKFHCLQSCDDSIEWHVLLNWESDFPNIINSDYRTIQITSKSHVLLHLRQGAHLTTDDSWTNLTRAHTRLKFYLRQTRHTSGHFNMNAGVKGDDGEQGKAGNVVSRRVPPHRVNVGCLWSLSCVWNELLVLSTGIHTHTHYMVFSMSLT